MKKALILDLDDTIFETRTMDPQIFEPFFLHLKEGLKSEFDQTVIDNITADLWRNTWDKVISTYSIPMEIILDAIRVLDALELNLAIVPYADYCFVKELSCPKYLVTTSLTSLQQAKIRALNIEHDFVKIVINDTFKESKTKFDIFKELVDECNLVAEHTYVIGDNAESEIEAGNALNMVTVQMLRKGVVKGNNAKYYIRSFEELQSIFRDRNDIANKI